LATTPLPETFSRLDAPFAVGDWEVHPRSNEIRRGTSRVKLEPKVMQVLCFLASQPGAVVSREELEAEAWPGMVVTYDAVTSAIIKLRKALGDEARHPHYIETLSKSGYRLIAEVRGGVPDEPNPPVGRAAQTRSSIAFLILIPFVALVLIGAWLLLPKGGDPTVSDGGGTVSAPVQTPGIAVLPFVNLGAVPEQDYFADGITEDLITDLSKLSDLWVVARNSAFAYRGGTQNERAIARELGVDYVLKGSVQRSADRIRINVRLIDGLRGSNLWAERYDRRIDDLFVLQDEIAASILSAIEVEVAPSDRARLGRSHLASIEAYDAFLRGLDHYGRRSLQDTQMAIDHYRRAIAIDPEFARAHAGLALVYVRDAVDGWDLGAEDGLAKAEELIAQARALDPMVPQIHFVQGQIDLYRRNYAAAIRSAEQAIAIKPNYADAHALLAWILHFAGRSDDGLVSMERAVRLNPRVPAIYRLVRGALYYESGEIDRALADFEAAVDMSPSFQLSRVWLAAAYAAADRPGDAEWETREILALDPDFSVSHVRRAFPIKDPIYRERFLEDLRRAGLPG
jgi:TolB-like protein/DNA-binding winged helix-turn-helix (wHTH) protein/Tfp pilus assembly protein PilF